MDTSMTAARAEVLERQAVTAKVIGLLSAVAAAVLLFSGVTRLWQSGDMPSTIAANYLGSAIGLSVLGVVATIVAAAAWVVGAQREATAEAIRALGG